MSLAYPLQGWVGALFSVAILFHHYFPLLERFENVTFFLPRHFPADLIIFAGGAGRGTPPSPQCGAGRGTPPSPRGRFPAGRGAHPWNQSLIAGQETDAKIKPKRCKVGLFNNNRNRSWSFSLVWFGRNLLVFFFSSCPSTLSSSLTYQ